jgi:hypothetical protein
MGRHYTYLLGARGQERHVATEPGACIYLGVLCSRQVSVCCSMCLSASMLAVFLYAAGHLTIALPHHARAERIPDQWPCHVGFLLPVDLHT